MRLATNVQTSKKCNPRPRCKPGKSILQEPYRTLTKPLPQPLRNLQGTFKEPSRNLQGP